MASGCIFILRAHQLDESSNEILNKYEKFVIKETEDFFIEHDNGMTYASTDFERKQLIEIFGSYPKQLILIIGRKDLIYVAAYEIIKRFGGLLQVYTSIRRAKIESFTGIMIGISKVQYRKLLSPSPSYFLVDYIFIREFFDKVSYGNFEKFKLDNVMQAV